MIWTNAQRDKFTDCGFLSDYAAQAVDVKRPYTILCEDIRCKGEATGRKFCKGTGSSLVLLTFVFYRQPSSGGQNGGC